MIRNTQRSIGKPLKGFGAYSIARQCPISGGNAVFKARPVFYLVQPNYKFDDRLLCNRVGIPLRKPNVDKQLSKGFKIYPNPTSQSFTVEYAIDKNCESVLYITNSIGQTQLTKAIDNNKNSIVINSENYASGIYSCRIICAENILFQQKFIIIK
ncbi:MAG TPA: T9SS type A sorting domain-containing protein [Bacteroidia bacterium]|nr:T9SS type A sorting domain-containing protein [Bacteroidia bacterium]